MNKVQFSVAAHAAWAPNLVTGQQWIDWAKSPFLIHGSGEPDIVEMPAMLRRRAGFLGKMALEVAYQCLSNQKKIPNDAVTPTINTPTIFCSRHGDVARATDLLLDVVQNEPLSPTNFGLAVHNATAGLFSIARKDQANHIAISAGQSTVEHGVVEACSLLADGASQVLLVNYDTCLPSLFSSFEDCKEQPYAWAWLMVPASRNDNNHVTRDDIQLSWQRADSTEVVDKKNDMPPGLQVLQFYLRGDPLLVHRTEQQQWCWSRCA
jgi:hypothetical protein